MNQVLDRVLDLTEFLEENAARAEEEGRLPDDVAAAIKATGVIRMLQPKEFGGLESHPLEYMEAVYNIGIHDGSAGWVAGVVGVHPHELAQGSRKMQEELWAEDPDTWIASPYAPFGRARPVEGGWIFNGRWPFSSGTDHCQWVSIGGLITDQEGTVADPEILHFVLPRSDYEIAQESWHVMGLKGTGSKDLIVRDAFVPSHRGIRTESITAGSGGAEAGRDNPLYAIPRNIMFSACITTATLALAAGCVGHSVGFLRKNPHTRGAKDPYQLAALGEALADLEASKLQLFGDMGRAYDRLSAGEQLTFSDRAEIRRNQVRCSHRAVDAADAVFKLSGGAQLQSRLPMQRFWRDAQASLHHIQNQDKSMYQTWGLDYFGHEPTKYVKV